MGGPGSGRIASRLSVEACRMFEIGELCDGGRWASQPRGELLWLARGLPELRARLSYAISVEEWPKGPELIMTLRYRETPDAPERLGRIMLDLGTRRGVLALCPDCGRPVRKLYARPGAISFSCRDCQGLVYRRGAPAEARERMLEYGRREAALAADLRAVIGPLLEEPGELAADGTAGGTSTGQQRELERLLGILVNEPPFAPQELRIYCLRLSGAGFSVRRIAALVGSSKSSVDRYLVAGLAGVDLEELQSERRKRLQAPPPDVTGYDGKALREVGVATISYVRRLGLDRIKASDLEERVVIVADAEEALDPDIMRRPPRTPDRIEAPVAPLPKPVPDDLPRRAKSVSLSRGPARWKTG